jgi:hypothetical protein
MEIEVIIDELRGAGHAAKDAAAITSTVDLRTAIAPAGTAIAGSTASTFVTRIGETWMTELTAWRNDIALHGDSLIRAADRYASADLDAEADFDLLSGYHRERHDAR